MNLEKFTDRAKGFLQSAQTVAIRLNHQRITPEHVLKALLEDNESMAAGLIQRAGGTTAIAQAEVDKALAKIPAVTGGGSQQAKHHEHGHGRAQRDQATSETSQTVEASPTAAVQKPVGKSGCCCS